MLIELTAIFTGKEIPLLLNPQHIASIAKPTAGRRTEGWKLPEGPWTYIDMTTGAYHLVKGSYEEVRDKWEKALHNDGQSMCGVLEKSDPFWIRAKHWQATAGGPEHTPPEPMTVTEATEGVPGKGDPVLILQQGDWHHDDCPAHGAPDGICVECTCTHLRHDPNNEPS